MSKAHRTNAWRNLSQQRRNQAKLNDEPCSWCGQPIDYTVNGNHPYGATAAHPGSLALGTSELLPPISELTVMHRRCAQREGGRVSYAKKRRTTSRPCAWCGCELPSLNIKSAKYCSDECRADATTKPRPAVYTVRWTCRVCGTVSTRDQSYPELDRLQTCGGECAKTYLALDMRNRYTPIGAGGGRPRKYDQELRPHNAEIVGFIPAGLVKERGCRHGEIPRSFLPREPRTPARSQNISLKQSNDCEKIGDLPDFAQEYLDACPVPPRFATPPPSGATGSYGPQMIAWARESMGITLWPWQALAAVLGLVHDSDGRLLHRRVGVSVPRQVGKSWLLRALAGWRIHAGDVFGEPQLVLHVSHSLNTTEEVFLPAIAWARDRGLRVREANGQMRIEAQDGSRWVPRSTQTGYGFSVSLALVDEAWSVEPRRVDSTYAPTLTQRAGGQIWLFSTASQAATALFPVFRSQRRDGWCLLEWSGPDLAAATPIRHSAEQLALCADELASDADTFGFERLNRWPEVVSDDGLLPVAVWDGLRGSGDGPVLGVGVEAAPGRSPMLAQARRSGGRFVVSVREAGTAAEAAGWCDGPPPMVGKSLLTDPVWQSVGAIPAQGTAADACGQLLALVRDDVFRHDGGQVLGGQVLGTRAVPTAAGLRLVSRGRTDAIKAAVWAVVAARDAASAQWFAY